MTVYKPCNSVPGKSEDLAPGSAGLCLERFAESSACLAFGTADEYKWFATLLCSAFDGRGHGGLLKTSAALCGAVCPLGWINRQSEYCCTLLNCFICTAYFTELHILACANNGSLSYWKSKSDCP